jgi:hypothetical protein
MLSSQLPVSSFEFRVKGLLLDNNGGYFIFWLKAYSLKPKIPAGQKKAIK